jgi:hypothetical protein
VDLTFSLPVHVQGQAYKAVCRLSDVKHLWSIFLSHLEDDLVGESDTTSVLRVFEDEKSIGIPYRWPAILYLASQ